MKLTKFTFVFWTRVGAKANYPLYDKSRLIDAKDWAISAHATYSAGRFIRNGEGKLPVLSRLSLRGQRVPRLVRLMILFSFRSVCLSDLDDTSRRLVIYDFRASTCILRPRKRERMSMHLRVHQALVIGRAFVRYHPNPSAFLSPLPRFIFSPLSFSFFSFIFSICANMEESRIGFRKL